MYEVVNFSNYLRIERRLKNPDHIDSSQKKPFLSNFGSIVIIQLQNRVYPIHKSRKQALYVNFRPKSFHERVY